MMLLVVSLVINSTVYSSWLCILHHVFDTCCVTLFCVGVSRPLAIGTFHWPLDAPLPEALLFGVGVPVPCASLRLRRCSLNLHRTGVVHCVEFGRFMFASLVDLLVTVPVPLLCAGRLRTVLNVLAYHGGFVTGR